MNFFEGNDPTELARQYQTPLYVYNERILRQRCRDLKNMVTYPHFVVDYSAKANCGLAFLQIVRSEGLEVDAMSPGEIYMERMAGFSPEDIFYICNNVSPEEMQYAIDEARNSDDPDKQAEFQRLFGNKIPSPEEFICVVGKNLKF